VLACGYNVISFVSTQAINFVLIERGEHILKSANTIKKNQELVHRKRKESLLNYVKRNKYLYLLMLPGVIYLIIFKYVPMYGVIIAFKNFSFTKGIIGSPFNNFQHFRILFASQDFYKILFNSVYLSIVKIIFGFPVPIIFALMLNEVGGKKFKRITQTVMYLPHFISWVVIGGIVVIFLSADGGLVNESIKALGFKSIPFLASENWFRTVVIVTDIWKEAGWGTIIYLASLTSINPEFYEAATVDGANRWQQIFYITLPCISNTIIILLTLKIGGLMSNGFEQIYILQNPMNMAVSDIFETYTYRVGLTNTQYSYASAVGLFQSVIGLILIFSTNKIAKMFGKSTIY
jgi:putative aldouronate transport system permease protein